MSSQASNTNGTAIAPTAAPSHLSGGAIAGVSVGAFAAAAVVVAALSYLLRRRMMNAAAIREANKVYPEEAYLYDPPRTPPPEMNQMAPAGAMAGAIASRDFGNGANGSSNGSFQPGGMGHMSPDQMRSFTPELDESAGLIPGAAVAAGAGAGGWHSRDQSRESPTGISPIGASPSRYNQGNSQGLSFSQRSPAAYNNNNPGYPYSASNLSPIAYSNAYPHTVSPVRPHINTSNNAFSAYGPRTVNPASGSFAPVSASRPVAYGLGVSKGQVAGQAALGRSRTIRDSVEGEIDPNVAESPADVRRAERSPLSPEGAEAGGDISSARRVSYGGAEGGAYSGRRNWGW